tara:strand:- start:137 stop:349 length:213 start_codon:yes stop_codon:yes gene_type:complete
MSASNLIKKAVPVADLKNGDTVEINGKLETVSRSHLKRGFTGRTYKGDPHKNGILKVTFKVQVSNGFRYE